MRQRNWAFSAALFLALGACGSADVVVIAELEMPDPDQPGATLTRALGDLEIQLIPFDRDVVFDSLTRVAATPEPTIPEEVLAAQDSIRNAQAEWQALEVRWASVRDELQTISQQMSQFSRGENRYRELFTSFNELEGSLGQIERQKDAAFDRFDALQTGNIERANEVRIQMDNWANDAFSEVDVIFLEKVREAGREILADTTSAEGATDNLIGVPPGDWWVHARYELPFSELYWNVPVQIEAAEEPTVIRLTRENAQERVKL